MNLVGIFSALRNDSIEKRDSNDNTLTSDKKDSQEDNKQVSSKRKFGLRFNNRVKATNFDNAKIQIAGKKNKKSVDKTLQF